MPVNSYPSLTGAQELFASDSFVFVIEKSVDVKITSPKISFD